MKPEELLETIIKEIVSQPEKVEVTKTIDEMGVLIVVKVGEGDAGLTIGREGKTIQAIRTIMAVVGAKNRARLNVKLDVPQRGPSRSSGEDPLDKIPF